jgi:hypothetical protein
MELMPVFRTLLRRRLVVLAGLVAAVAALAALTARSPGPTTAGTALSRVLIDTPDSMLTNARVAGSSVSGMRAALFADLMSSDRAREQIAKRARISPDDLVVRGGITQEPLVIGPLAERAAIAAADQAATYVLAVAPESRLPIVNLSAYGPDVKAAKRLAEAASATMATFNTVPAGEKSGAVVRPLGPAQGSVLVSGGSNKRAVIAAAMVFVLVCGSIVLLGGLARWWRGLAARDVPQVPRAGARASLAFAAGVVSSDLRRARRQLARGLLWRPRRSS